MKSNQASSSPNPNDAASHVKRRTKIALCCEQIDYELRQLDQAGRILALAEILRRFSRRMETEGVKMWQDSLHAPKEP